MTYTILTSILVCGSLYTVLSLLSLRVRKKASEVVITNETNCVFTVSGWYWLTLLAFFSFLFLVSIFPLSSQDQAGIWGALIIPMLMLLFIGIPLIYAGFVTKVKIIDGRVYYNNGMTHQDFSIKNIIKCELSSFFLIEVIHANDPKKAIIISPMFKDLPRLVAILSK